MFFLFKKCFCAFNVAILLLLKTKTYKIKNMMHVSWAKTPFPDRASVL